MRLFKRRSEQSAEQASAARETTGERIRLSGEDYAAQNPYHAAIARGYHLAQLALFSLLVLFLIVSMLVRSDDITYENLFYLVKDIHAAVDSTDVSFSTLVYDADETQQFAAYRGGLAVAGESGLTVFTATGRNTLTQSLGMTAPGLLTSSRYILVYEQGGEEIAVYNSFARLFHDTVDGSIHCAAMSDAGWFAVAAQTGSGSSTVSVYNKNMQLKTEFFKNSYVTALAMNAEGTLLAVVSTEVVQGDFCTHLELYRPGTDEKVQAWSFDGLFPLACSFADKKTVYLTGTDRTLVLKQNGEITLDIACEEGILRAFHCPQGFAVTRADGTLMLYTADGACIGERAQAQDIRAVLIGESMVHMMSEYELMTYHIASGESSTQTYDFPLQKLLWYREDELLLCSRSMARYYHVAA